MPSNNGGRRPGRSSTIYSEATTADGRGVAVKVMEGVLTDRAGMPPQRLDDALESVTQVIEDGAALLKNTGGTLERLMRHLRRELDKAIAKLEAEFEAAQRAPHTAEVVRGITPQLGEALQLANSITTVLDRVNRMVTNAAKAQDQVARLRIFIATGDEDDHGLSGLSENALRRMINATAQGELMPPEQRRE